MNSKLGKSQSYNLYSCSHLSNAKIHLKLDPSGGSKKFVTYCSRPNPSIQINSSTGQTTVFLPPPSRSVLKTSNELEENIFSSFKYNDLSRESSGSKFTLCSNFNDYEKHEMFNHTTSGINKYNANFNNRFLPNILKTKSVKARYDFLDVKNDNENKSIKDRNHRKRKQVYNLPSVADFDQNNSKERNLFPCAEKKRKIEPKILIKIQPDNTDIEAKVVKKAEPKTKKKVEAKIDKEIQVKIEKVPEAKIEKQVKAKTTKRNLRKSEEEFGENYIQNQSDMSSFEEDEPLKKRVKIGRKCKIDTQREIRKEKLCARICPFLSRRTNFQKSLKTKTSETDLSEEDIFINPTSENQSSDDETPRDDNVKNESSSEFGSLIRKDFSDDDKIVVKEEDFHEENCQEVNFQEGNIHEENFQEVNFQEENIHEENCPEVNFQEESSQSSEKSIEDLLGFENFKGFQSEIENFEEFYFQKKKIPFPVDGEFLIPDYLNYMNSHDLIDFSDDVHKLLSRTLCSDSIEITPIKIIKNNTQGDLNVNNVKISDLNFIDFDVKCNFDSPIKASHLRIKNALINGYSSEDFDYDNDDQCSSNCSNNDSSGEQWSETRSEENRSSEQIIVEINDKILNSKFVENCEEEENSIGEIDNTSDDNKSIDNVPDSPKSIKPNEEINRDFEINIDRFKCHECDITFGKQRSLIAHQKKTHLGLCSYTCKRCRRLCKSKIQLQKHYNHCFPDNRKSLNCNICDKKYSYQSSLSQHLKKKHFIF